MVCHTLNAPTRCLGCQRWSSRNAVHRASIAREDAMGPVTMRNDESHKPNRGKAFRVFHLVSGVSDFGLITRRSRVQIPPPLRITPGHRPGVCCISRNVVD